MGINEILEELKASSRCMTFQGIKCDNKDCKRYLCPLNKRFDLYLAELKMLQK